MSKILHDDDTREIMLRGASEFHRIGGVADKRNTKSDTSQALTYSILPRKHSIAQIRQYTILRAPDTEEGVERGLKQNIARTMT